MRIPASYLAQPRWWGRGGRDWLDALPKLIDDVLANWDLSADGEPVHGSHALVIPVRRHNERFVLRLCPPDDDVDAHVTALRFWAGKGTVRLINADAGLGAMLLERLGSSLDQVPVADAMAQLGTMMRRLAMPAPESTRSTADLARDRALELTPAWQRLREPFPRPILDMAIEAAERLSTTDSIFAVNGDLHSAQVLRGEREPWLTVDPLLLRGDIAYDLGRVLWTRLDEMLGRNAIVEHFDIVVRAAFLDRDHARDWVLFRTVDYWLWGLDAGFTEDPIRCARLAAALIR